MLNEKCQCATKEAIALELFREIKNQIAVGEVKGNGEKGSVFCIIGPEQTHKYLLNLFKACLHAVEKEEIPKFSTRD